MPQRKVVPLKDRASRRQTRPAAFFGWFAAILVMSVGFNAWLDAQENPNRSLQTQVMADGAREVTLERNRSGHYTSSGTINGHPVRFMLGDGASDVSIPESVAKRIGLERGSPAQMRTANGTATVYRTRLDQVSLGGLTQNNVRGSINPHMAGDYTLLGMTFLGGIDFSQSDGVLTLRGDQND